MPVSRHLWKCKEVTWSLCRLLFLCAMSRVCHNSRPTRCDQFANQIRSAYRHSSQPFEGQPNSFKYGWFLGWLGHSKSSAVLMFDIALWLSSFYSSAIFITIQSQINSRKRYRTTSCYMIMSVRVWLTKQMYFQLSTKHGADRETASKSRTSSGNERSQTVTGCDVQETQWRSMTCRRNVNDVVKYYEVTLWHE